MHAAGEPFILLEASDRTGGRVCTDTISTPEGDYLIDRGFQVLLTAYPHAAQVFNYDELDLRSFYPGAMVFHDGEFHRIADPRRRPGEAIRGFRSPIATMLDKLRLAEMSMRVLSGTVQQVWSRPDRSALEALRDSGFADATIDRFFRPFFGGVFFDAQLTTSSRMLEFCFRMFAQGRVCVPAMGMGQLAAHLTVRLPSDAVHTGVRADRIERRGSEWLLDTNQGQYKAKRVVVATEGDSSRALLAPHTRIALPSVRWRQAATISYACDACPTNEAIL
ncbi:MAG: FAD-dependent oxidoreductase, partial [Phycisphaerales bacterium JB064]